MLLSAQSTTRQSCEVRLAICILFAGFMAQASPAYACTIASSQYGIVFDEPPTDIDDEALVLEVRFERRFSRSFDRLRTDIGRAQVVRVVRGIYGWTTVDVLLHESSCAVAPQIGDRGFIVGRLGELSDGTPVLRPYGNRQNRE